MVKLTQVGMYQTMCSGHEFGNFLLVNTKSNLLRRDSMILPHVLEAFYSKGERRMDLSEPENFITNTEPIANFGRLLKKASDLAVAALHDWNMSVLF